MRLIAGLLAGWVAFAPALARGQLPAGTAPSEGGASEGGASEATGPAATPAATPAASEAPAPAASAPTASEATAPADPADADRIAEAEALKQGADAAYLEGDYLLALQRLRAAYDLDPRPGYVANQGLVLEQLGRYAEAVAAMQRFLATDPPPDKAVAAHAVVDRLTPPVRIETDPPGAEVRIGEAGTLLGETPLDIRYVAGSHLIEVRREGHAPLSRTAKVLPREGLVFRAALAPLPETVETVREAPFGHRGWGFVLLGGAAVAGAAAGVFYGLGLDAAETRDAARTRAAWDDAQSRLELLDTSVTSALGVAGAAAIIGVVLIFVADDSTVGVVPTATPKGGGATVFRRF